VSGGTGAATRGFGLPDSGEGNADCGSCAGLALRKDAVRLPRDLGRVIAVIAIFFGAVVIGLSSARWDPVFLDFPGGHHGLHVTDAVGMLFVTLGVAALWHLPRQR
jgi:hypothetical protein